MLKHNNYGLMNVSSKELYTEFQLIRLSYRHAKRVLKEHELYFENIGPYAYKVAEYIVSHVENVVEYLDEKEKFLLTNEIILGKKDNWFKGYYSDSTYYRIRTKAYRTFLIELER